MHSFLLKELPWCSLTSENEKDGRKDIFEITLIPALTISNFISAFKKYIIQQTWINIAVICVITAS